MVHSNGLTRSTLHLNWKVAYYNLHRLCFLKTAGVTALLARQWRLRRSQMATMAQEVRENA
ncbi:hypothetical protein QU481_09165 [Crenobacter sp. SG2303]|uniref:Transposase n=1 Tax=Crenobacter oryzisoli TaxID=3056844 RepID=A0ABT7XMN9_9NEIS|nr:hypothetical protein [Crenobacter sp. SG2303]MDN0075064.1 hypothetical protein [Crenobacter sp. SG2303]